MNYLSVENLSKSYGERTLFENLTFGIHKGQKVALIAKNGNGKSTLMKILAGIEDEDSGTIAYNGSIKRSYLPQEVDLDSNKSILENIFLSDNGITKAIKSYEKALLSNDQDALEKANDLMDLNQAWDFEAKAKQILGKLEIHDLTQNVSTLSGGQKKRIGLAKVLIDEPDFLLLDEPTNHLDLDMIEWLEEFFKKTAMTILMITHDRYFLEVICDEILELENLQLYKYTGNFTYYLEKKSEREEQDVTVLNKAKSLLKQELKWMRSTPKARTGKSKYREDQFDVVKSKASKNLDPDQIKLQINTQRIGSKIIELHNVSKGYENKPLIKGFDYTFKSDERVGIIGKNGTGKTTLLNLLTQKDDPDTGKVVVGDTIAFGYYNQKGMKINESHRVIDVIRDVADVIPLKGGKKISAEQLLERFLFDRKSQRNFVSKLSGGEKKRLFLLTVLMKNPNFLILDEPTNDLDIFTLSILEEYLLQFPGVLVVVSHDRYFMDKLVDHLFVLDGNGAIKDFPGNYSDWREKQSRISKAANSAKKSEAKVVRTKEEKPKTKLSFNEKYEFDNLEKEIPKLEKKKKEWEEEMNSGSLTDHEDLMKLANKLGDLIADLDQKTERWMELSEFM